ncbi:hypothetical protein BC937DRAFT_94193 [Endogone sp. FLAS-F59071]|nr:hypothetical protein BC937DRAFT_94193 [Endogone sp. FLAS-F59071]|eukprot:RUS20847.1 hypothetical protein BC937DRAFT_94193 [Endogone sp. FLAS-F59071]
MSKTRLGERRQATKFSDSHILAQLAFATCLPRPQTQTAMASRILLSNHGKSAARIRCHKVIHRAVAIGLRHYASTSDGINKYSSKITQPKSQGASQAMRKRVFNTASPAKPSPPLPHAHISCFPFFLLFFLPLIRTPKCMPPASPTSIFKKPKWASLVCTSPPFFQLFAHRPPPLIPL